jgi:glutathione S-transferase
MIKLHCSSRSTFSRRARIALIEKRIEHELVLIDMAAGAHKSPQYLALNPYGRVPTLQENGFVLYESTAILGYLESLKPEPSLFPADSRERARVHMHMKLCDIEFTRYAGAILFPKRFQPKESWNFAAFDEARVPIERHLAILAKELDGTDFLVGDSFTAADLVYLPHLQFLPLFEVETAPAVQGWADRLLSRPSAKATTPDA